MLIGKVIDPIAKNQYVKVTDVPEEPYANLIGSIGVVVHTTGNDVYFDVVKGEYVGYRFRLARDYLERFVGESPEKAEKESIDIDGGIYSEMERRRREADLIRRAEETSSPVDWEVLERSDHQERVEDFMRKAGQSLPDAPTIPDEKVRLLRAKLIFEEALETITALGISLRAEVYGSSAPKEGLPLHKKNVSFYATKEPDLVEIADGCADIIVVTTGTLSACGIADKRLQELIDESNLAKFTGDGHKDPETGKWVKPSDWKAPDIAGLLEEQRDSYREAKNRRYAEAYGGKLSPVDIDVLKQVNALDPPVPVVDRTAGRNETIGEATNFRQEGDKIVADVSLELSAAHKTVAKGPITKDLLASYAEALARRDLAEKEAALEAKYLKPLRDEIAALREQLACLEERVNVLFGRES